MGQLTTGTSPSLSHLQQACLLLTGRLKRLRSQVQPAQGHAAGQRLAGQEPKATGVHRAGGQRGGRHEGRSRDGTSGGLGRRDVKRERYCWGSGRETNRWSGSCGRGPGKGRVAIPGQKRHSRAKAGAWAGPVPRGIRRYITHWPPRDSGLLEAHTKQGHWVESYAGTHPAPKSEGIHLGPGTPLILLPILVGGCLPLKL